MFESKPLFNDVTSGNNKCAASLLNDEGTAWLAPQCCAAGFSAAIGWDPVSGQLRALRDVR